MSAAIQPIAQEERPPQDRAASVARELSASHAEGGAASLLARVELALRDHGAFHLAWPYLALAIRREPRLDRTRISRLLAQLCDSHAEALGPGGLRGVAHVAHECFDPLTARRALARLEQAQELSSTEVLLKAKCLAAVGAAEDAIALCDTVMAREPQNEIARRLRRIWAGRIEERSPAWRTPIVDESEPLLLEPLNVDHAPALAWQYRDPSIATKTVLPPLPDARDAVQWVTGRLDAATAPYALVHRDHGLVGYCELAASGQEVFLCVWIGVDWQGRGFGRRLIAMACRHALKSGMDLVLTAAFDSNTASLRALHACGFTDLPIRAADPDHERTFLYQASKPMDTAEVCRRLVGFTTRTDSGLVFPGYTVNEAV